MLQALLSDTAVQMAHAAQQQGQEQQQQDQHQHQHNEQQQQDDRALTVLFSLDRHSSYLQHLLRPFRITSRAGRTAALRTVSSLQLDLLESQGVSWSRLVSVLLWAEKTSPSTPCS